MTTLEYDTEQVLFDYSHTAIQQQSAAILDQLNKHFLQSGENVFLLVDPAKLELNITSSWLTTLTERRPQPVALLHASIPYSYYPWLITLDLARPEDQALLQESIIRSLQEIDPAKLRAGCGRTLCGWLTSMQPARVVARQLGSTAVQKLKEGGNILLRYFDPAVHNTLWPHLSIFQQQRMLGILSGWYFPDGDGQLVSHQHTPPAQPLLTFSLALQENDNAMLERVGIVNQALKQYREQTKHDSRMSETALRSIAELALQRIAHSPVITTIDERVLFAFHALRYHAHIDLSPEFQYLLSTETQPADIRYRQRICALTPKDWQRLADECQHLTVATHKNKELLP